MTKNYLPDSAQYTLGKIVAGLVTANAALDSIIIGDSFLRRLTTAASLAVYFICDYEQKKSIASEQYSLALDSRESLEDAI